MAISLFSTQEHLKAHKLGHELLRTQSDRAISLNASSECAH